MTDPFDALRRRLGAPLVDDFLRAAEAVGSSHLSSEENLAFGFVQRVLMHLRNHGESRGMLFPKRNAEYRPFVDYFDGEGRIVVIEPGEGPGRFRVDPTWFRELDLGPMDFPFYEVVPGAQTNIVAAFLAAYADVLEAGEQHRHV